MHDRAAAQRYVEILTEAAWSELTWQTFADADSTPKRRDLALVLHGTLDEVWDRLVAANDAGAGVFACVNETDGHGRKSENVLRVRALYVDCDHGRPAAWHLPPSLVVQSSAVDKIHAYWLVSDCALDEFKPAQLRLIKHYGSDNSINDLSRVLRVPGFWHRKGEPVQTVIESASGRRYTLAEVLAEVAMPVAPSPVARPVRASASTARGQGLVDWQAIDIVGAFQSAGRYGKPLGAGKHSVICPWDGEHTSPDGATASGGTVVWESGCGHTGAATFACSHSHCQGRTVWDALLAMGVNPPRVERAAVQHEPGVVTTAKSDTPPLFMRGDEVELGQHLATTQGASGDVASDAGLIWQCRDALWHSVDDEVLARQAMDYAGMWTQAKKPTQIKMSAKSLSGVVKCCKIMLHQSAFFAQAPEGAPFVGSFARLDGERLVVETLTREHRVKVAHVPAWTLPVFPERPATVDRLLAETWAGCDDIEDRIQYFWEWLGAALCGITTRWKDTPLLVGIKDTGKSAVLNVIASVFPVGSHRSVPLHAMSHEYHRAHLSGGRINFVNELPSREVLDGEEAKSILSGQSVNCRLPSGVPFDWVPRIANAFACNELPPSQDRALMDRMVVLDCPNVVPQERQDRALREKILHEAPDTAAAALAALPALLARGRFVRPGSADGMGSVWKLAGDPVAMWAEERVRAAEGTRVPSGTLYQSYRDWCDVNGHGKMSSTRFSSRMMTLGFSKIRSNGSYWEAELLGPARQIAESSWLRDGVR